MLRKLDMNNLTPIVELEDAQIDMVAGGPLILLAIPFVKGFVMGAGTVAAGAAVLDAVGLVDLW
jgi:hypothetical protein